MSDEINLGRRVDVNVLDLRPGQVLAVRLPTEWLNPINMKQIREQFEIALKHAGLNNEVLLMPTEVVLEVIDGSAQA
jgi:hypothetical protein